MMWTLERSFAARSDLIEIWDYIAAENTDAADRQLDRIESFFQLLKKKPNIGRYRSDIEQGLRGFTKGQYLILYRLNEKRNVVEIIRVVHGMRDLAALFQ